MKWWVMNIFFSLFVKKRFSNLKWNLTHRNLFISKSSFKNLTTKESNWNVWVGLAVRTRRKTRMILSFSIVYFCFKANRFWFSRKSTASVTRTWSHHQWRTASILFQRETQRNSAHLFYRYLVWSLLKVEW